MKVQKETDAWHFDIVVYYYGIVVAYKKKVWQIRSRFRMGAEKEEERLPPAPSTVQLWKNEVPSNSSESF